MERVNKNKPPASGARPTFTKAWIKRTLLAATTKSAANAMLNAAPAAAP